MPLERGDHFRPVSGDGFQKHRCRKPRGGEEGEGRKRSKHQIVPMFGGLTAAALFRSALVRHCEVGRVNVPDLFPPVKRRYSLETAASIG
jgi:hypothetical protein